MEGLEIKQVKKSFEGKPVLTGISFQLPRGEILAVLGPSGSGKSTLLEVIAGLERPDSGDILWNGNSLLEVPTHQRNFGLMFQEYVLFPHLKAGENIAFGLNIKDQTSAVIDERVNTVLELVGLVGYGDRDVSTLSGGEQQRVALARSLAPEPRLVMLDEPLGALDRTIRERLVDELRTILKDACQTALYVTHDQEEAFKVADKILILGDGLAVQIGTAREIFCNPGSPYVARFLGMTNLIAASAQAGKIGSRITTRLGSWQVSENLAGEGQLLLRPDKIQLKPSGSAPEVNLTGELISSSFSGSSTDIHLRCEGIDLRFELNDIEQEIPGTGEMVEIWFDPDRALHFYLE